MAAFFVLKTIATEFVKEFQREDHEYFLILILSKRERLFAKDIFSAHVFAKHGKLK